jgi:hypothetical protein
LRQTEQTQHQRGSVVLGTLGTERSESEGKQTIHIHEAQTKKVSDENGRYANQGRGMSCCKRVVRYPNCLGVAQVGEGRELSLLDCFSGVLTASDFEKD